MTNTFTIRSQNSQYANSARDCVMMISPSTMQVTLRYIGLRTYLYNPRTTRCRGGSTGESVPRPVRANSKMQANRRMMPSALHIIPKTMRGVIGVRLTSLRPKNIHGTYPATNPGSNTVHNRLRSVSQRAEPVLILRTLRSTNQKASVNISEFSPAYPLLEVNRVEVAIQS